jgi:TonB family protein
MKKLLIILLFVLQQATSIGQVNVFIGKTKAQIKDFWATKISSIYFNDTEEDVFIIMVGNVGTPAFQAIFNEKGKCTSHQTAISFKDISVMLARLKKAGYKHDETTDIWIDPTKKISAKINHYGLKDYYSFDFETISKEKTTPSKKIDDKLIPEKEDLKKITDFAKSTFGEKSTCSFISKKGNCCGSECNENIYTINDGTKIVVLVSTFDVVDCDGKKMVTAEILSSNKYGKANSLAMMFEKLKNEIENSKADSTIKQTNETKISPSVQREVFTTVDEMPEFPGGTMNMAKFIQQNIQYPPKAKEAGISGKCFIKFVIEPSGEIGDVLILKGVPGCKECDEEAIRVIKSMPKWKPGKQGNKLVPVFFNYPVNFQLR